MKYFVIDELDTVVGPMSYDMAKTIVRDAQEQGIDNDLVSAFELPGVVSTPPVGSDCHSYMSVSDWMALSLEWLED